MALAPKLLQSFLRQGARNLPGVKELSEALRPDEDVEETPCKRQRRRQASPGPPRAAAAGAGAGVGCSGDVAVCEAREVRTILGILAKELAVCAAAVTPHSENSALLRLLPVFEGSASLKHIPRYLPLLRYLQWRGAVAAAEHEDITATAGDTTAPAAAAALQSSGRGGRRPGKRGKRGGRRRRQRRGRYTRRNGRRRRRPPRSRRRRGVRAPALVRFTLLPLAQPGGAPFVPLHEGASSALKKLLQEELECDQDAVNTMFRQRITQSASSAYRLSSLNRCLSPVS